MARAETHASQGDPSGMHTDPAEPTVSAAIEHLVASTQGVITKRIDLALLEGQELIARTVPQVALGALALVLAVGAWFAVAACLVLLVTPNAGPVLRLGVFGLLNAAGALGLVLASRSQK